MEIGEDISSEKVFRMVKRIEKKGFEFFVDSHSDKEFPFYAPHRVKLPDGRILDEEELDEEMNKDPTNKTLKLALHLFDLCLSEQYFDFRDEHHLNFDGDKDVENCRKKYR